MRSSQDTPDHFVVDALATLLIAAAVIYWVHAASRTSPPADPFPFTAETAQGGR